MKRLVMIVVIINVVSFYAPAICFDGFELNDAKQIYGKNNQTTVLEKKENFKISGIPDNSTMLMQKKQEAAKEQMNKKNSNSLTNRNDLNFRIFDEMQTN